MHAGCVHAYALAFAGLWLNHIHRNFYSLHHGMHRETGPWFIFSFKSVGITALARGIKIWTRPEEMGSCWFSPLWMWLWGANSWAHSPYLPTPEDSMPTVLARRHWHRHQALGASYRTTADSGLPNPSSLRPEDLTRPSQWMQKKKNRLSHNS